MLRLFLIEDMTGPIVEIIGRAYSCHPHFFAAHIESQADPQLSVIDANGVPGAEIDDTDGIYASKSFTDIQSRPFFSFPYRKAFSVQEKPDRPRMHRSEGLLWLDDCEERVSACFYELDGRDARVGNLLSILFSFRLN